MRTKRLLALMCCMAMLVGLLAPMRVNAAANDAVQLTQMGGWLESAYVQWTPISSAEGYVVYVKKASEDATTYTRLDNELVRKYETYFRADAVGIPSGDYVMKVVPVVDGAEVDSLAQETGVLEVKSHVREGFAFSAKSPYGNANGGYNADGTPKSNATIIYVTDKNKDTVTINGDASKGVGLYNIIAARSKAKDESPLIIRLIGKVTMPAGTQDYLLRFENTKNITVEGIGEDAVIHGYGIGLKRTCNFEMRNVAIMWYGGVGGDGDSLGLDTENKNIWIHNCEFYYGAPGGDADQAKGDGSIDIKARTDYVTISYNHFVDSGKAMAGGGVWEAKNPDDPEAKINLTYHHNWFDHSDSRHPRCVAGSVHVYNNYYDGNSIYGIGSAVQSSLFVENNYFRNVPRPMIIATQGSDVYDSATGTYKDEGTLSGQTGGMIKSYGNVIVGAKRFFDQNTTPDEGHIDAYTVTSASEQVPDTIKALSGGHTYNNFDTASSMYAYTVESAEDAVQTVLAYAGCMNGGDVEWQFDNSVEDTNHDIIPELQVAVRDYTSRLISVGGVESDSPSATPTATPTASPSTPTSAPSQGGELSDYTHNFTTQGKDSTVYTMTGDMSNSKGTITYNGLTLTDCLKVGSGTNITFTAPENGTFIMVFNPNNGKVNIKVNGTKITGDAVTGVLSFEVVKGTEYVLTKGDTANLYYMTVAVQGTTEPTPTAAPTPAPTAAPTATPAPTADPTPAPTAAPTASPTAKPEAVTGDITSYVDDSAVTIELIPEGSTEAAVTVTSNTGKYTISGVDNGAYTMRVSKANHVTRKYAVTITDSTLTQSVELNPIGDVTGDGTITIADYVKILAATKGSAALEDYARDCADINGDSMISIVDYVKVLAHAKGMASLW